MSTTLWTGSTSAGSRVYELHYMSAIGFRIDDSDWIKQTGISASNLDRSSPIRRLALAGGSVGSRSQRRVVVERGGSSEFEFSRATVVGFWWGLLLRDHNNEGNMFILTLIGGERQQSLATVRRLGRCLPTVRAASGESSAQRTCRQGFLELPSSFSTDQLLRLAAKNSNLVTT
jgi:hypothetical protein